MNFDYDESGRNFLEHIENRLNPKTSLYHWESIGFTGKDRGKFKTLNPPMLVIDNINGVRTEKEVPLNNLPNRQFDYIDYGRLRELDSMNALYNITKSIKGVEYTMSTFVSPFLSSIECLGSDGVLVFKSSERILSSNYGLLPILEERKKEIKKLAFKDLLEIKGLYINAVLGLPKNISRLKFTPRGQNIQNCIFILSRRKTQLLFVASINDENYFLASLIKFLKVKEELGTATKDSELNLETGCLINKDELNTFSALNAKIQVNEFRQHYKEYKIVTFGDLIVNFSEKINYDVDSKCLFIQKVNSSQINIAQSNKEDILNYFGSEFQALRNMYVLTINNDVNSRYLEIFFQSKLGESVYRSQLSINRFNYSLSKENLKKIPIFVPSIEKQEQIILADENVKKLQNSIDTHRETLALNPSDFIAESMDKVYDMLDIAGKLNDADRILSMVRKVESTHIEFKETWKYPTDLKEGQNRKTAKEIIKYVPIKVICSFLNSDGGNLIIGIHDKTHEILGIDEEISYKNDDKTIDEQLDKFNGDFWKLLEKSFLDEVIQQKLIETKLVKIRGVTVYDIKCKPCKEFVCLIQLKDSIIEKKPFNGNDAYIRVGSDSNPMDSKALTALSARLATERERNKS